MEFSAGMIINIDLNAAALLFMAGVLVMALRTVSMKDMRSKLLINLIVMAIVEAVCGLMLSLVDWTAHPEIAVIPSLIDMVLEIALNLQLCCVFFYVMYEVYKSEDYVRRKFSKFLIPIVILVCLPVVNLFTSFFWYVDANGAVQYTFVYLAYNIFRYLFLVAAVILYIRFKSREKNAQRFNMWLLVIPMFLGTLAEAFTGYGAFILGAAIGYTNLYMLIANEMGYRDHESGFYNPYYLSHLYKLVDNGKYQLSSIITYQIAEEVEVGKFADAIRSVLPDECDTIRTDADRFITVSESADRGYIFMLSEDVAAMAEEAGLEVSVESVTRNKKEIPADFFIDNIRLRKQGG